MAVLTAAELVAGIRSLPRQSGSSSPAMRRLQEAWAKADAFAQASAALLLKADGEAPELGGEPLPHVQMPTALALPVLASSEDWAAADPLEVPSLVMAVVKRMTRAGYRRRTVEIEEVVSSAWLPGPAGTDTKQEQIVRVSNLLAESPIRKPSLVLARGLVKAVAHAGLVERYGLAMPEELKRAIGSTPLAEVAKVTGHHAVDLSRWANGVRRMPPSAALWALRKLESESQGA